MSKLCLESDDNSKIKRTKNGVRGDILEIGKVMIQFPAVEELGSATRHQNGESKIPHSSSLQRLVLEVSLKRKWK